MPKYLFCGGLQCWGHNYIWWFVRRLCMENDFIISDYALLPQDTFTYISDAHNTSSWIDHFVSSLSVHQAMFNMDVLIECILSDHRVVAVSIQCSHLPELDDEVMGPQPSRIDWLEVTTRKERTVTMKAKTYLINCSCSQRLGTVKSLKADFRLWVNCNKPTLGGIYRNVANTKEDFKYSLRQCRNVFFCLLDNTSSKAALKQSSRA